MFCNFIEIDNGVYRCTNCDTVVVIEDSYDDTPIFPCKKSLISNSKEELVENIKALAKNNNESKQCTEEQILLRHSICSLCEDFKDGSCNRCGCPITRNKDFANKLLWADQECPIGKWGKITY